MPFSFKCISFNITEDHLSLVPYFGQYSPFSRHLTVFISFLPISIKHHLSLTLCIPLFVLLHSLTFCSVSIFQSYLQAILLIILVGYSSSHTCRLFFQTHLQAILLGILVGYSSSHTCRLFFQSYWQAILLKLLSLPGYSVQLNKLLASLLSIIVFSLPSLPHFSFTINSDSFISCTLSLSIQIHSYHVHLHLLHSN